MTLDLNKVASNPSILTSEILNPKDNSTIIIRPLERKDVNELAEFLKGLSLSTRKFCTYTGYDLKTAKEFCNAIARYDKLRFVATFKDNKKIIALFEFSFNVPDSDHKRYSKYKIQLNSINDCRLGPCIADDYQNRGLGSLLFSHMIKVAIQFGKKRIILWGGVLSDNQKAIHYYEKLGFEYLGKYINDKGDECIDMIVSLQ